MLGYQPFEFPAGYQSWASLLHPDDRIKTENIVKAYIDNINSTSFEVEFRLKTKGGCWKWILGRGKTVERDAEGRALRLVGTHVDLTAHKQAQEAMRVVEERFNFAIKDFQDGLWDWNIRTNEMYLSPRWKQMLGYEEQELSNHPEEFFNRLHTDDIGVVMNRISGYLERRIASCEITVRLRHKSGHYLWILLRGSARWDAHGKPLRLAGINTDISNSMRNFS
jgi:PAS domain S-box-containing protein